MDMVRYAIDNLEGMMLSLSLPSAWYNAPQGQIWDAGQGVVPDPHAGHEVLAVNYDDDGVDVITWNYLQRITNAGLALCATRADATIAEDMTNPATGATPLGFNVPLLVAKLAALN